MGYRGGYAGRNSVTFYNDSGSSTSIYKEGEGITHSVSRTLVNEKSWARGYAERIPFIRGISFLLSTVLVRKKLRAFYLLAACLYVAGPFLLPEGGRSIVIPIPPAPAFFILTLAAAALIRFSEVAKYHAAEHMVANTLDEERPLTLENVRASSRIHRNCGTNLIVFVLAVYVPTSLVLPPSFLLFVASIGVGYELYQSDSRWFKPLYQLGSVCQHFLFTAPAERRHLLTAIDSMSRLEEHTK